MRTADREIKKRLDSVIQYLSENGETNIEDMANFLSVSPLTVRRNIKELQEREIVMLKNNSLSLTPASEKKWYRLKTADTRKAIQKAAAQFIETGDVCYINTSYTALGILQYAPDTPFTVITNNMNIVNIEKSSLVKAILTGGEIHPSRSSVIGENALRMINLNKANKCFIGVDSINLESGLSGNDISEAALTRQMIESCTGEVYLVVTSDKFVASAPFYISSLGRIHTIITDSQLNMLTVYDLRRLNINVVVA